MALVLLSVQRMVNNYSVVQWQLNDDECCRICSSKFIWAISFW